MLKIGIFPNFRGQIGGGYPSISAGGDPIATKICQQTYFQMLQRNIGATKMAMKPWKKVMTKETQNSHKKRNKITSNGKKSHIEQSDFFKNLFLVLKLTLRVLCTQ